MGSTYAVLWKRTVCAVAKHSSLKRGTVREVSQTESDIRSPCSIQQEWDVATFHWCQLFNPEYTVERMNMQDCKNQNFGMDYVRTRTHGTQIIYTTVLVISLGEPGSTLF
jgi:hypothetical protein